MLYDKGITVHCTTRSSKKVGYIKKLCPDEKRLKIFTGCDLLKDGSFDDAIQGCNTVCSLSLSLTPTQKNKQITTTFIRSYTRPLLFSRKAGLWKIL